MKNEVLRESLLKRTCYSLRWIACENIHTPSARDSSSQYSESLQVLSSRNVLYHVSSYRGYGLLVRMSPSDSLKFSLQNVKISSIVRKKLSSSSYLENANLSSVTLDPKYRKSYVFSPCAIHPSVDHRAHWSVGGIRHSRMDMCETRADCAP